MLEHANDNRLAAKTSAPAGLTIQVKVKLNRNFVLDRSIFVLYSDEQYKVRFRKEGRNDD